MPAVTPEEARLYTDPERSELNMVFQFEHVLVDHDQPRVVSRPGTHSPAPRTACLGRR
jgi:oligo-1,6-glucosidase